jgi:ABC-2 type transport system ATP-binding protein
LVTRFEGDEQAQRARDLLVAAGIPAGRPAPGTVTVDSTSGAAVNALLGAQGIWASEITPVRPDLERAFLDLTGNSEVAP